MPPGLREWSYALRESVSKLRLPPAPACASVGALACLAKPPPSHGWNCRRSKALAAGGGRRRGAEDGLAPPPPNPNDPAEGARLCAFIVTFLELFPSSISHSNGYAPE